MFMHPAIQFIFLSFFDQLHVQGYPLKKLEFVLLIICGVMASTEKNDIFNSFMQNSLIQTVKCFLFTDKIFLHCFYDAPITFI